MEDVAPAAARAAPWLTALGDGTAAALRAALAEAGYDDEAPAAARRLQRLLPPGDGLAIASIAGEDTRLRAITQLLALGQPVPLDEARGALSPASLEDLAASGLLTLQANEVAATCSLVPQAGLLLAGDGPQHGEADLVHAFTNPSLMLAQLIPHTARHSMLDLGTGSGVLALLGASDCDRVTGVDINPRALMFARFNAGLNGVENLELLEGSWFEPVGDRRFDLIVANPPYVVSPDQEFTYRDSGLPPGALLERLCQDTAAHLEPGGIGILVASWPHACEDDWATAPTAWVKEAGCDALVLGRQIVDPLQHAMNWNTPPVRFLDPPSLRQTMARWLGHYRAIDAGMISFGTIVLRRRDAGRPWLSALPARLPVGDRASEHLTRLLGGQDQISRRDDEALLDGRFSVPDGIDVSQRFQRRSGRFVARPAMVSMADGLGVRAAVDPDALDVLFACDGHRTLREAVESLAPRRGSETEALAPTVAVAARELLAHGLLETG